MTGGTAGGRDLVDPKEGPSLLAVEPVAGASHYCPMPMLVDGGGAAFEFVIPADPK